MATTWRDIDGNAVAFDDDGRVRLVVSDGVAGAFDSSPGSASIGRGPEPPDRSGVHADPPTYRREAPQASAQGAAATAARACRRQHGAMRARRASPVGHDNTARCSRRSQHVHTIVRDRTADWITQSAAVQASGVYSTTSDSERKGDRDHERLPCAGGEVG